jgi:8-oxo-dGTP pyrophosphatase MutT (NUDIX family)
MRPVGDAGGADWPALALARQGDATARVPLQVAGHRVGSVARAHLAALAALAPATAPDGVTWAVSDDGVRLNGALVDAAFARLNAALRAHGLVRGWRDELYPLTCLDTRRALGRLERASARFWGTLTLGSHANGWVAGADGRPAALWIAQRSLTKPTDPGMHDNLIGGGVPAGQTPWETLQREGWEEAGLGPDLLQRAVPGRIWRLEREVPEGWQLEELHVHDLALPAGVVPLNQDGEVARFDRLPVAEALALARGSRMTVDASLATLDFALRHGLLGDAAPALSDSARRLWAGPL